MEHHQVSGNVIHDITDHLPNFLILDKIPFITTIFLPLIGPNLAANIPNVNMSFYNFLSNLGSPQLNSFYLSPTNLEEIEQIIGNLNPNKATGPLS